MAERPVFVPIREGPRTVMEVPVTFRWHPGMASSQKRRNVDELHAAAAGKGLGCLLEVSTKSERLIGRRLSAFHQKLALADGAVLLECAYQGSKVFEHGGPFVDLFRVEPREAKRDVRLSAAGRLVAFELEGRRYPLLPVTAFYDWLYIRCLFPARDWLRRLDGLDGFTDIEFNPTRSINCQARACATFVALEGRGVLDEVVGSFDRFVELQTGSV